MVSMNLATVFVHLIACCVAVGMLMTHDLALVKRLINPDKDRRNYVDHLLTLKRTISIALVVLWLSGIVLVCMDAAVRGWESLANPKLQAKILIVILLTLNGFLLHSRVIPALQNAGFILKLSFKPRMLALFTGSVSAVSWFYAAMLGVGRSLAWKYSLVELLLPYPFLVAGTFSMMLFLTMYAESRRAAPLGNLMSNTTAFRPRNR
jgi:hypothetical protein